MKKPLNRPSRRKLLAGAVLGTIEFIDEHSRRKRLSSQTEYRPPE